jgi:quercetin dioxygenase-like cupin family protein
MKVVKLDEVTEYVASPPLRRSVKLLIDHETVGAKSCSMGISFFDPGDKNSFHSHNVEEIQYVIRGRGTFHTEDEVVELGEGAAIFLQANERHKLENNGTETLWLLWVYAPPGSEETIRTWPIADPSEQHRTT